MNGSYLWSHHLNNHKKSRKSLNICQKLSQIQIFGPKKTKCDLFYVTKLSNIITQQCILAGHIFLGFSGCNRFIISYTVTPELHINTNLQGGSLELDNFAYTLHWWKFNLSKKLTKVSSVKLFLNEEITNELILCYLEWPNDKSKILICGCLETKTDSCYYVTIAATPSLNKCSDCQQVQNLDSDSSNKCLTHGFTAHFHYQVSLHSTRTSLLKMNSLKIDNLIVLNMSHCITVLSVGTNVASKDNLPLSSIKRASFEESVAESCNLEEVESEIILPENYNIMQSNMNCENELTFADKLCLLDCDRASTIAHSLATSDSESSVFCEVLSIGSGVKNTGGKQRLGGPVSFAECFFGGSVLSRTDEPIYSDVNSLFCSTVLFASDSGRILYPKPTGDKNPPEAFSQNLVLDLEYVIFDILRTRCYNTYRYGYLRDYEANMIDVSPDVRSVVIHIAAFIEQRVPMYISYTRPGVGVKVHAEFIISWNLKTGRYEVVVAYPLRSFDEKKYGKWSPKWLAKIDKTIALKCNIPVDYYRRIYMLSNKSVCLGKSLQVLWNCDGTIALAR